MLAARPARPVGCPGCGGGACGGGDAARGCSPLAGRLKERLMRPLLPRPPLLPGRPKRALPAPLLKLPTTPFSKLIQISSSACAVAPPVSLPGTELLAQDGGGERRRGCSSPCCAPEAAQQIAVLRAAPWKACGAVWR